ncbi:MAG TPA: protein kinase, partial [Myxococcaceae bacterium]|nr:protein kinase [Myxococcaceae bacterium]
MVARGGFGTLLSALREHDGQRVALKLAHAASPMARELLVREAEVLRAIGPPIVPAVYETGTLAGGTPWLAMQFVPLPTLAWRLARQSGPLPEAEFPARAQALMDALAVVHGKGFLHGELKPENIFLDEKSRSSGFFD